MIQITSRPSSPKNPRAGSSLESHFKVFVFIKLFFIQSFGDVVLRERKLSYGFRFAQSFQMIANGVSKFFTSFSLQLAIARFTLFILKKSRFVEVLFYPKNELLAFPKVDTL